MGDEQQQSLKGGFTFLYLCTQSLANSYFLPSLIGQEERAVKQKQKELKREDCISGNNKKANEFQSSPDLLQI
ncbi:hypothetical protein V2J09_022967 [Rumex salicifolius]